MRDKFGAAVLITVMLGAMYAAPLWLSIKMAEKLGKERGK